jgi:hypothetical protein
MPGKLLVSLTKVQAEDVPDRYPAPVQRDRALVAKAESVQFFRSLCPNLSIEADVTAMALQRAGQSLRPSLARDGYAVMPHLLSTEALPSLADCMRRLVREGLPPAYAFVYDAFWSLFAGARDLVSRLLDADYGLLPDFWAWHVPAEAGHGGWPAHRDFRETIVRQADGLPGRLTVWVALTDAPREHACISVVPRGLDPNYPSNLNEDAVSAGWLALPVEAGGALVWDANLLHRSGPADPGAPMARISAAVTLQRRDFGEPGIDLARPLPFRDRLDAIAAQIVGYAWRVPELAPELREWATVLWNLRRSMTSP